MVIMIIAIRIMIMIINIMVILFIKILLGPTGNKKCWDGEYNYQRCCVYD